MPGAEPPPRAVILAAGLGRRLGALTRQRAKALLRVGGASLLAHSIARLREAGVTEVWLVTGHAAPGLAAECAALSDDLALHLVHNPHPADSGSLRSLWLALRALAQRPGPVVVLESDILYHRGLLAAALAAGPGDRLVVADASGSGDEVHVVADAGGRLAWLGKRRTPPAGALGELAGITRCTAALQAALRDQVARQVAAHGPSVWRAHYETELLALARDGWPIAVVHRPGLPWTEVDTVADLRRARRRVWPALAPDHAAGGA